MAPSDSSTNFWQALRSDFAHLRAECAIDPPLKSAGRLVAIWYALPEPHWRLDHWNKKDGNGVTERFKWHAQSAAARQGFAGDGEAAVAFWLDQILHNAPEAHIRRNRVEQNGSEILYSVEIFDICGLSADYCRKCEADETRSEGANISPTDPPELPLKLQNAFEVAKADAELNYSNRGEQFPPGLANSPLTHLTLMQDVLFAYCLRARQACQEGIWTVAQARRAADAMVGSVCELYFDQGHLGPSSANRSRHLTAFRLVVGDDPRWKHHLSEIRNLAESELDREQRSTNPPALSAAKKARAAELAYLERNGKTAETRLFPSEKPPAETETDVSVDRNLEEQLKQQSESKLPSSAEQPIGAERRELVTAFLAACNQVSQSKIHKAHIWRSVGHTKARQFEYWQAGQDRAPGTNRGATLQDDRNFRRILATEPETFVAQVAPRGNKPA